MTIKLDSLAANLDKERDGEYIDIPDWPGVSLGVRSINSPRYQIARDQLVASYARKYRGKPAPPDVRARDIGRLCAQNLLFGWKGFDEEYSEEIALEKLTDPAFRELAVQVEWAAGQVGLSEVEFIEAAAKNSAVPFATS